MNLMSSIALLGRGWLHSLHCLASFILDYRSGTNDDDASCSTNTVSVLSLPSAQPFSSFVFRNALRWLEASSAGLEPVS